MWYAVRDLPPNTRISSNEVSRPEGLPPVELLRMPSLSELEGRYSTTTITNGESIKPEQLVALPRALELSRSATDAVLFLLTPQNVGVSSPLLNAGRTVFVFEATNRIIEFGPYVIETVVGNETNCILIRVPLVQAERLRKLSKPEIRFGAGASTTTLMNSMKDEITWIPLKSLNVPETETTVWTPALDCIAPNRLYRFKVTNGTWKVDGTETSPDGQFSATNQDLICKGAPFGALVAKVGGSTADATGTIFAVGRYCIYVGPDAPTKTVPGPSTPVGTAPGPGTPVGTAPGPASSSATALFLGANVPPNSNNRVEDALTVVIEIAR
jgi:hypothetical protein